MGSRGNQITTGFDDSRGTHQREVNWDDLTQQVDKNDFTAHISVWTKHGTNKSGFAGNTDTTEVWIKHCNCPDHTCPENCCQGSSCTDVDIDEHTAYAVINNDHGSLGDGSIIFAIDDWGNKAQTIPGCSVTLPRGIKIVDGVRYNSSWQD